MIGGDEARFAEEQPRFELRATALAGECRSIEGLYPGMTVSDLKIRVMQAFSYGDCTRSFQGAATFYMGVTAIAEGSQTLRELGVSAKTVVSFVVTEPLLSLKCSDDKILRVVLEVACLSGKIKAAVEEHGSDTVISLPDCKIDSVIKAMDYCAHQRYAPASAIKKPLASTNLLDRDVSEWDVDFMDVDQEVLCELSLVANSLDIGGLIELLFFERFFPFSGKTTEEIRKQFHIVNEFTLEEEENLWSEDNLGVKMRDTRWCAGAVQDIFPVMA